jgi:O-antigen ligase
MHDSWITRFLVFIAYCSIPFLGGNHLPLFYVTIDKFWIENVFLLCLIVSLMFVLLSGKHTAALTWGKFLLFFAPIMTMSAFSLLYTWNTLNTLKEINTLLWAGGTVYLMCVLPDKNVILKALVVGAFLSSLCAIMQFTILYPKLIDILRQSKYALLVDTPIPFSSFLYHNIFGGYLASIVPISLYFAVYKKRIFYSITTAIILAGLILTTTRIGIGLAMLSMAASLILSVRDRCLKRFFHIAGLVFAGLLMAVLLMNTHTKDAPSGVQREIAQKITNITAQIKTLNTRTEIWKGGFRAFVSKPILGYGAGTFEYPYKKYYDGGFGTKYAHSTVLKIGVEIGIIGVMCWLFYLVGLFAWVRNTVWDRETIHIFLAACSFFLFSMVDFSFDTPAHIITFFLLTSLFVRSGPDEQVIGEKKRLKFASSGMIILLSVLLVFSFYFTTKVNLASKSIETATAMAENGFPLDVVFHTYEDAVEKMSLNDEGFIRALTTLLTQYNSENAAARKEEKKVIISDYLTRMESKRDRNPELFYTTGTGYATLRNNNKAGGYLNEALFYCPSSSYYVLGLAEYYFNLGDNDKAIKTINSFTPYMGNYENAHNPNGYYVYKMRDLAVEIALKDGNVSSALVAARENLRDAERERFVIRSIQARELAKKEIVVDYLRRRVDFVEKEMVKK